MRQSYYVRFVSEKALFSNEAGRHFILNFGFYCSFHHDEAVFLFYSEIVNGMRQVSITNSEFPGAVQTAE